jgi:Zn-finger nucleic acid-binding protein
MSDEVKCPKCKNATMAKVLFQGVEVDRCPKCSGIWFDLLEQEDLRKKKGSESVDVGARKAKLTSQGQKLDCPKCHTRMSPTHDARQPHIVFEKCSACYGVFFDAGEFADLKKTTFKEFLKDLCT